MRSIGILAATSLLSLLCAFGRPAPAQAQPREGLSAPFAELLGAYESIRAELVRDRAEGIPASARRMAAAARRAAAAASELESGHLRSLATAAERLAAISTTDFDALRRGFGEVSRPLVALLGASPALARGLHVFECPMASGYRKWVQRSEGISNPYMGTRMPRCGRRTQF